MKLTSPYKAHRNLILIAIIGLAFLSITLVTIHPALAVNTIVPITGGTTTQQKIGSFSIGNGWPTKNLRLCLNAYSEPLPLSFVSDPDNCITSWNSLGPAAGRYVNSFQDTPINPDDPTTYQFQSGYASIVGQNEQQYSSIIKASGADGSIAVYGSASGNTNAHAGYFQGTTYIGLINSYLSRLCLNGYESDASDQPGGACISSWSELAATANQPQYVLVQDPGVAYTQYGGASISGGAVLGTVAAGNSNGISVGLSCGDGICNGSEDAVSCPIDCDTPNPIKSFNANYKTEKYTGLIRVNLYYKTDFASPQDTTGNVKVIIVRARGHIPEFVPVDGVDYAEGTTIGDSTIVYSTCSNVPIPCAGETSNSLTRIHVDILPGRGIYYYVAYQSNLYPRYSIGLPSSFGPLNPIFLSLNISPAYSGDFQSGDEGGIYPEPGLDLRTPTRNLPGNRHLFQN